MVSAKPLVSVITTARNASAYLDECIASVTASRYENIEVILIDDGSSDSTASIARRWEAEDSRLRVMSTKPQGRRLALIEAHKRATGELQCWVDADDRIHPDAIGSCVDKIDDKHQLVYSHRNLINSDGSNRGPHAKNKIAYKPTKLLVSNMIFHLRMFTTEVFDRSGGVGGFESAIDWDMNLRMAEQTNVRCIPRPLYDYRIRPDRMSGRPEQAAAGEKAVREAINRRKLDVELVIDNDKWRLREPSRAPTNLRLP